MSFAGASAAAADFAVPAVDFAAPAALPARLFAAELYALPALALALLPAL